MTENKFMAIRVPPHIIEHLDKTAARHSITRSELVRQLFTYSEELFPFIKEQERHIAEKVKKAISPDLNPALVEMVGRMIQEVMTQVAEQMATREGGDKAGK